MLHCRRAFDVCVGDDVRQLRCERDSSVVLLRRCDLYVREADRCEQVFESADALDWAFCRREDHRRVVEQRFFRICEA